MDKAFSVLDQPLRSYSIGLVRCDLLIAPATWHFGDGQKPLRSRAKPFGLQRPGTSFNVEGYGIEPAAGI